MLTYIWESKLHASKPVSVEVTGYWIESGCMT
jgi:hypothetical protein